MAIDNLNYYSAGLPAGQLTDRYSSNPGCLKSKNLDIFSSSKSVKATAWRQPTTADSDVIKQDGKLLLKTDGKVYERTANGDVLVVDPSVNFPVYQVSYNGKNGTYADAQWGTVQDMVAKYEGDELKAFTVFTDRSSYTWSAVKYVPDKSFTNISNLDDSDIGPFANKGYLFTKPGNQNSASLSITIDNPQFSSIKVLVKAVNSNQDNTTISLDKVQVRYPDGYYYDAELDGMTPTATLNTQELAFSGTITDGILLEIPTFAVSGGGRVVDFTFKFTKIDPDGNMGWSHGELYIDMNGGPDSSYRMKINGETSDGDYNEYYSYLPVRERKLVTVGDYGYSETYWMKGTSFQPLYKWTGNWVDVNGEKKTRYDFVADMGWATDVSMDIVGMMIWNEQVYMIGNMNGDGYIIPCDLSGGRGTPYIAYGCEFKGATNIDYLMYLVGEDRGISTLWVYNGQELVPVIGGNKDNTTNDIIGVDEQYKFDGKMANYRKNLILTTKDNRIFEYGQTFGGKGGAFIHEINGEITGLRVKGNDLIVKFEREVSGDTVEYETIYQDDTPIKRYNSEWLAVYPIILGNHLLEKEESDLYTSFILPSANTSLEFWGMANHYHFRTFTSSDDYTFSTESSYYMEGAVGDYELKFIERNENRYTFKLEGDLPVQTTNDMQIIDGEGNVLINYSDFNHFRKIGEITTDKYWEGEFRFHNLNNKLDLPRSHSLQVMVKGKGNQNYTPELFALDLVANQRERG